ncbi:MAG: hypothetical protein V3U60_11060 [Gammaproteobacteria bacterium]
MAKEKTISVKDQAIDLADLPLIAEQIVNEYDERKKRREDPEKMWVEVDRQVAMEPELSHKMGSNGKVDPNKKWLPETELPLQAQTLEMLTSDCRRLEFPRGQEWFLSRAALNEDYLKKFADTETPIVHEKGRFQGPLNQDNADRLVGASLNFYHRQYDLKGFMDQINAESLSYGFGVGRFREVNKRILSHELMGRELKMKVPMLIPRSAKNVYLDDSMHAILHEGQEVGPNIIQQKNVLLADLMAAAKTDKSYVEGQLNRLTADKDGEISIVELEGDLVYETSKATIVVRDVVLTAATGKDGKNATFGLIRHQSGDGSTYLIFNYHMENTRMRTGTSPLMKGMPINRIMAQTMNRLLESGALAIAPPLGYSKDEPSFAASGGPVVHPYAQWETTDEIKIYKEVGGDPAVFFNIFGGLNSMYADVTGMNAPRLGAQTKSHTTAFAKDAELSQGAVRTVDYVSSSLEGPLTRFLEMEYRFALKNWKKQVVFVEAWDEFVELRKGHLPNIAMFRALGDATTIADLQSQQRKINAIQLALQVDNIAVQLGREPRLDHGKIVDKILQDGGVQDLSEVTSEQEPAASVFKGQQPGVLTEEQQ